MKILGVDDNPDIIQLLEMTVESLGHEFESALGGREGLEKIRKGKFNLIFLDLSMPDFMGLDVIDALEKEGLVKENNIVLFTASYLGIGDLEKDLQKRGINSVMSKPADIDQIMAKISEIESML